MISSASNSQVKQVVAWQTKSKERKKDGVFVVEGWKMYLEAPKDKIVETYVSSQALAEVKGKLQDPIQRQLALKLDETGFQEVTEEVFTKMSDTQSPQGILCVVKQPSFTMEDLLSAKEGKKPLLVLVEDLQDPGNLGTIFRTAEGAGVTGILMTKDTVDRYNPKVIRSTMGSIYRMPHMIVEDLVSVVRSLREKGIKTYAAHLQGENYYDAFDFKAATAFLIGNEGKGLQKETADAAGQYLKIPMEGQVESLNAAVSASLLVYEAHRQRQQAN